MDRYIFIQWRICTFAARGGAKCCTHGEDGDAVSVRQTDTLFLEKLREYTLLCPFLL